MRPYTAHIIRFFALLFFQVIILNNINISGIDGLINPFIYPLFILLLPITIPHGILLLSGFIIGIGVDIFSGSMGLHAFTTVFVAFLRPFILKTLAPTGGYETEHRPTIQSMGLAWFVTYSAIFIAIHHALLFFIEVLSFNNSGRIILKIILSGIFSIGIILLWEYLFYPKKK